MTAESQSPRTFCEAFQSTAAARPDAVALRTPGDAVTITWREYDARVRAIAAGLAALGVGRGETVGLMLTNRPEFHLVDTGALHAGAVPFSIYNTNPPEMIAYLFGNAGNRVVITEAQFVPAVLATIAGGSAVEHVVCVDGKPEGTMSLAELEAGADPTFDVDASWRAVTPADLLTIVYTSGTTGPPKGVELTHANLIADLEASQQVVHADGADRLISYLPDAHLANRWICHYASIVTGLQITTVAVTRDVLGALTDTRPTIFMAVPQIWYKIKAAIEAQLLTERSPVKRKLAGWAIGTGRRVAHLSTAGASVPALLHAQHRLADALVLSRVRARLGLDQVRFGATGAAPIATDALEFVLGLGIPVCEAWGMTELSAVVTVNPPDAIRIGTVGPALPGVEVRVADDGELLVRGPIVMKGYHNDPGTTAEAVDADGWMHTGDVGSIDDDGYVRIVDRKKELIINATGKNMSPSNIEGAVRVACPLVGSAVAIGDERPCVTALLVLDPDGALAYAAAHGLTDSSPAALAADPGLRAVVDAGITAANATLSQVEQIKAYVVLPEFWEPGGAELTPTMKLKRRPIAQKYAAEIDALYRR